MEAPHLRGRDELNPDFDARISNEQARQLIEQNHKSIQYSAKYEDDRFEYRHVILPKELSKLLIKGMLLTEREWRLLGVQQSAGWVHYMIHRPEPHVLCFRRPRGTGR